MPPAHTPVAPPKIPPPPPVLPDELLDLLQSINRRLNDVEHYQLKELEECQGPNLSSLEVLAGNVRSEMTSVRRDVEEAKLQVDDLDKSRDRRFGLEQIETIENQVDHLGKVYRHSVLIAKNRIDAALNSKAMPLSARDELFSSSSSSTNKNGNLSFGATSSRPRTRMNNLQDHKDGNNGGPAGEDDALMSATADVTEGLRRTMQLMQQELDRSLVSNEILEQSTSTMKMTTEQYSTFTSLLNLSKSLITSLERADILDRLILFLSFGFFLLICFYIFKKRVLNKGFDVASTLSNVVARAGQKVGAGAGGLGGSKLGRLAAQMSWDDDDDDDDDAFDGQGSSLPHGQKIIKHIISSITSIASSALPTPIEKISRVIGRRGKGFGDPDHPGHQGHAHSQPTTQDVLTNLMTDIVEEGVVSSDALIQSALLATATLASAFSAITQKAKAALPSAMPAVPTQVVDYFKHVVPDKEEVIFSGDDIEWADLGMKDMMDEAHDTLLGATRPATSDDDFPGDQQAEDSNKNGLEEQEERLVEEEDPSIADESQETKTQIQHARHPEVLVNSPTENVDRSDNEFWEVESPPVVSETRVEEAVRLASSPNIVDEEEDGAEADAVDEAAEEEQEDEEYSGEEEPMVEDGEEENLVGSEDEHDASTPPVIDSEELPFLDQNEKIDNLENLPDNEEVMDNSGSPEDVFVSDAIPKVDFEGSSEQEEVNLPLRALEDDPVDPLGSRAHPLAEENDVAQGLASNTINYNDEGTNHANAWDDPNEGRSAFTEQYSRVENEQERGTVSEEETEKIFHPQVARPLPPYPDTAQYFIDDNLVPESSLSDEQVTDESIEDSDPLDDVVAGPEPLEQVIELPLAVQHVRIFETASPDGSSDPETEEDMAGENAQEPLPESNSEESSTIVTKDTEDLPVRTQTEEGTVSTHSKESASEQKEHLDHTASSPVDFIPIEAEMEDLTAKGDVREGPETLDKVIELPLAVQNVRIFEVEPESLQEADVEDVVLKPSEGLSPDVLNEEAEAQAGNDVPSPIEDSEINVELQDVAEEGPKTLAEAIELPLAAQHVRMFESKVAEVELERDVQEQEISEKEAVQPEGSPKTEENEAPETKDKEAPETSPPDTSDVILEDDAEPYAESSKFAPEPSSNFYMDLDAGEEELLLEINDEYSARLYPAEDEPQPTGTPSPSTESLENNESNAPSIEEGNSAVVEDEEPPPPPLERLIELPLAVQHVKMFESKEAEAETDSSNSPLSENDVLTVNSLPDEGVHEILPAKDLPNVFAEGSADFSEQVKQSDKVQHLEQQQPDDNSDAKTYMEAVKDFVVDKLSGAEDDESYEHTVETHAHSNVEHDEL